MEMKTYIREWGEREKEREKQKAECLRDCKYVRENKIHIEKEI